MSNTAIIILAVTSFVANPSPTPGEPFCEISAPSFQRGPGNSGPENANGQVEITPDGTIVVTRRNQAQAPIKLVFAVGSGMQLRPTDIVFSQSRGSDDPHGAKNFQNKTSAADTISVEDVWVSRGKRNNPDGSNQAPQWKYFIRVTRGDQSAWIDPGIENSIDNER